MLGAITTSNGDAINFMIAWLNSEMELEFRGALMAPLSPFF